MRRGGAVFLLALIVAAGLRPASAASRVLPRLSFHVLRTPHFRVYFHQGLERQARLLAEVAESVWATVPAQLGLPPPGMTHVLLVDQDDASNGWATPLPYDTVMVTAAWPAPSDIIGNTSAWLRLVFTHEYTHVLQLHQSRGYARGVKAVFGRAPLAFPNLFLPGWSTEGLATYAESRFTGQGRLRSGDSFTIVADRVREAGAERMDQVTGGQVQWPAGLGPYLYGGFFTQYLAQRFGEEKLGELGRRTAGRLPYLASAAYRQTYAKGLGELWADYQRTLTDPGDVSAGQVPGQGPGEVWPAAQIIPRRLTREGYYVSTPRYAGDGRIVYGRQNADDLPAVAVIDLETAPKAEPPSRQVWGKAPALPAVGRRLAIRYGGEQLSLRGRIVFFDGADYQVNVAWRSDLYAAETDTGRVQRLTRDARLVAPDVSPDGRSLACISIAGGLRRVVVYGVEGTEVGSLALSAAARLLGEADAAYGSPRWSPDGTRLAVERRPAGGPSEIVVIDVASGRSTVVASSADARNVTPAWLPDGRALLFASDRGGRSFELYVAGIESGEVIPIGGVPGGAMSPEVSPDGRRLVYVGYTAAGYDLFEMPVEAVRQAASRLSVNRGGEQPGTVASPSRGTTPATPVEAPPAATPQAGTPAATPYRPFLTLLPRSWQPAGDFAGNHLRLGLSTGGVDILGRHAFGLTALWRVQAGSDAMYGPHRARPDWSAFYTYDRWRPGFFVAASDETTFPPQSVAGVRQANAELRERHVAFGASVPFIGVRQAQVLQAAFNVERNELLTVRGDRTFLRNAIQAGWAFHNAHLFGYSISPEQGVAVGVTSEQVRAALGADGNADAFTAEIRGYLRLGGRHAVLATRAAVGVANGDAAVARVFYLGGPQPAGSLIDFGNDALSLLRGFEDQAFAASHVGAVNVEYRFPLWRVERGKGNWPLFLRTLHGAVFSDIGQVWDHQFSWADYKASVGAELSIDTVLGFGAPITVAAGVAQPVSGAQGRGASAYVRFGRAF